MTQLLTQCPFCQTTFKVSDAQMQVASGVVRCGACMEVFLASQHRVILKERPFPAQRKTPQFEAGFRPSRPHARGGHFPDSLIEGDEPQWQVLETEPDDQLEKQQEVQQDESGQEARVSNFFNSWEEEENYRAAGRDSFTPPEVPVEKPEEVPIEEPQEVPEEEPEEVPVEYPEGDPDTDRQDSATPADAPAELPMPTPEPPAYGARLNPAGYAMTHFSVDHELPGLQHIKAVVDVADDATVDDTDDDTDDDTNAEAIKTAVIVRDKGDRIPTLEPDVVANEAFPAAGIGAQTLAWFQSFRKSLRDNRVDTGNVSSTDEKAVLRSHLSVLRDEDALEPVNSAQLNVLDETPVELLNSRQQWRRMQSAGMTIACLGLVVVLAGQYLWFNLDSLVRDRRMSAVTGLLCRIQDCPDPLGINLATVVTEELVVRSHPAVNEALQVDFIFRNDDNREQLFPLVELNFTNNDGAIVANRVFTTEEYLPPEMQLFTHMPAHSSIQVSLELMDPGAEATGYYLEFRNP